jgi:hypothetical protein
MELLLLLALIGSLLLLAGKTTKAPPQAIYIYPQPEPVRGMGSTLWLLVAAVLLLLALVQ